MSSISRRLAIKLIGAIAAGLGLSRTEKAAEPSKPKSHIGSWRKSHDRVWLGAEYWANPMEDWRIAHGAAECLSVGGNRSIHLLTRQFENPRGTIDMSVRMHEIDRGVQPGGAGFRVGVQSEINEYRSNCFAHTGINAGIAGNQLVLGDQRAALSTGGDDRDVTLRL
jgi:alkaline phosphatase D